MTTRQKNWTGWISAIVGLATLLFVLGRSMMSTSYAAACDVQALEGRVRVSESKIQTIEGQTSRMASQIDDIHKYLIEGARR